MKQLVYLAGPITGTSYTDSTEWRLHTKNRLETESNIIGINPLRSKDYLKEEKSIRMSYPEHIMSTSKSITVRDLNDVKRSDALLVNFIGATKISVGTLLEVGTAYALGIPIITVMKDDCIHQHAMLNEMSSFVVNELDAGIDILINLLSF